MPVPLLVYGLQQTFIENLKFTTPPPDSNPHLSNPNGLNQIQAQAGTLLALTVVAVALRMWARFHNSGEQRFGWDDWAVLIAAPLVVAQEGLAIYVASIPVPLTQSPTVLQAATDKTAKALFANELILTLSTSTSKLSVVFFYGRIFSSIRWFKLLLWVVGAIIWAVLISIEGTTIGFCSPVPKIIHPEIPGKCISEWYLLLVSGIPNMLIDIILLLLPLPMLWRIKASTTKKVGITVVFVCGCLVVIVSVLRVIYIGKVAHVAQCTLYNVNLLYMLAQIEPAVAVISVSLPSIGQYFRHKYMSSTQRSKTYGNSKTATSSWSRKLKNTKDSSNGISDSGKDPNRDSQGFVRLQEAAASSIPSDGDRSGSHGDTIFPISEDEECATGTYELEGKVYAARPKQSV